MRKLEKRDIILIILGVALIISVATNGVLIFNYPQQISPRDPLTLVVGTSSGPATLEIVDCWDRASEDVLGQVVETLFTNDLNDPDLPRINLLAESYWWEDTTTVYIKLREGIKFHDGTLFNASAAKWNLDRLQYLINATGTNTGEVAYTREIWMRPDEKTPIINNTFIVGEYNITITLNGAFGPFLNALTYINAGMISPTAHKDDAMSFIDLTTEKLVGTGPFVYESYTPDVEVIFSRWNEYWGNVAYFNKLKFTIIDDPNDAKTQLLNGQIDYNMMAQFEDFPAYEDDKDIILTRYTDDTGISSLVYQYLSINNKKCNQTWRKAMSFAINYSYIVDELLQSHAIRANSPISPGFGLSYNKSAKAANFNLTKAREIMVSMGYGSMSWTDDQWISVAETTPFSSLEYFLYTWGSIYRESVYLAIHEWFKLIGVEVYEYVWDPWWYPWPDYEDIDLYAIGWAPDYLDPFNMLNYLVNPQSDLNVALINDTTLNVMMTLALETTDDVARNNIYKDIQGYMAEEGYFQVPLYHTKIYFIHSSDLRGVPYNAMGKFQAQGIWRV